MNRQSSPVFVWLRSSLRSLRNERREKAGQKSPQQVGGEGIFIWLGGRRRCCCSGRLFRLLVFRLLGGVRVAPPLPKPFRQVGRLRFWHRLLWHSVVVVNCSIVVCRRRRLSSRIEVAYVVPEDTSSHLDILFWNLMLANKIQLINYQKLHCIQILTWQTQDKNFRSWLFNITCKYFLKLGRDSYWKIDCRTFTFVNLTCPYWQKFKNQCDFWKLMCRDLLWAFKKEIDSKSLNLIFQDLAIMAQKQHYLRNNEESLKKLQLIFFNNLKKNKTYNNHDT